MINKLYCAHKIKHYLAIKRKELPVEPTWINPSNVLCQSEESQTQHAKNHIIPSIGNSGKSKTTGTEIRKLLPGARIWGKEIDYKRTRGNFRSDENILCLYYGGGVCMTI